MMKRMHRVVRRIIVWASTPTDEERAAHAAQQQMEKARAAKAKREAEYKLHLALATKCLRSDPPRGIPVTLGLDRWNAPLVAGLFRDAVAKGAPGKYLDFYLDQIGRLTGTEVRVL
ncbi:MAG: hypothetical protein H6883_07110 [Rhodobiaceae bacterium]|nr:hypothetical protein [Rhodobiaceae bacterium]MCC0055889.1 hypothetical protein [Rhodobiaceae bacterium]